MRVARLQNSQDHLIQVHEIGTGVDSSLMGEMTAATAADLS